jgi:hypothetical protein
LQDGSVTIARVLADESSPTWGQGHVHPAESSERLLRRIAMEAAAESFGSAVGQAIWLITVVLVIAFLRV